MIQKWISGELEMGKVGSASRNSLGKLGCLACAGNNWSRLSCTSTRMAPARAMFRGIGARVERFSGTQRVSLG